MTVTHAGALAVGQSNQGYFIGGDPWPFGQLLGGLSTAWGVPRAVYTLGGWTGPDGWALQQGAVDNTWSTYGGTPVYVSGSNSGFLDASAGGDPSTWGPGYAGIGVRNFVTSLLTATDRNRIPLIWWLNTETDSQLRTTADKATYKAAVIRWLTLLRSWVGKSADRLPVFAPLPIPYAPSNTAAQRMIREVFHELATDPAMNFHIALRNTSDAEPRGGTDTSHIDGPDLKTWGLRLALSVSRWMRALYGIGPAADYGGLGPRITHAWAETATTTVITVTHDRGTQLKTLDAKALDGRGWSVRDNGAIRAVSAAAIIGANKVRITHAACAGTAAQREIGYCLFGERTGRNGCIYDNASTLTPPAGMSASFALDLPIAGTFLPLVASETAEGTVPYTISLSPQSPGTLAAAADGTAAWTTTITTTTTGGDSVEWCIHDLSEGARADWATLTGTAAGAQLSVPFRATGDYLIVRKPGDDSKKAYSDRVTVTPYVDPFAIVLSPQSPGSIMAGVSGTAIWTTTVTTTAGNSAEWAVFTAQNAARSGWATLTGTLAGATLAVPFLATGDYLTVRKPGTDSVRTYSDPVTVNPYVPPVVEFQATLSPSSPDSLPAAPDGSAEWTITVTTKGGDSFEWAVFTAQNWGRNAWALVTGSSTGKQIKVPFRASGDYLVVRKPGDDSKKFYSQKVTLISVSSWGIVAKAQATSAATLASKQAGHYVRLNPWSPGTLVESIQGQGAVWNVQVDTNGVSRVAYVVVKSSDFSWRSSATVVSVPPSKAVMIAPRLMATGDFVKVWDADDFNVTTDSGVCTIATSTPGGGTRSLSITPQQPGTVYEMTAGAGAPYTFTVKSTGISKIGWVVVKSSDFSWRTALNVVPTTGQIQVTARMVATGDFVKVYDANDLAYYVDSGLCKVALDPTGGAPLDPADIAFAKAWVKDIYMGADIERGWAWAVPGGALTYGKYLKAQGFDYVRLFYGWRPAYDMMGEGKSPPTKAQFTRILDAAKAYMDAGLKVILDCADVLTTWEDFTANEAVIYQHIRNCTTWIAERQFDRTKFACGPANEWGGNSDYTLHQVALHRILREALPGYVLVCGANNWKHYSAMISKRPFVADGRVLWDHHSYDAKSAAEWGTIEGQIQAWSAANGGLVTIWTEAGLGYGGWTDSGGVYHQGQEQDPVAWMRNIDAMFPAMHSQRPGFWAVTYGNAYRLNKSASDAAIKDGSDGGPDLLTRFKDLAAAIRADLGDTGNGGDPGSDPGGNVVIPLPPQLEGLFDGTDPFNQLNQITIRNTIRKAQDNFNTIGAYFAALTEVLKDLLAELIALHTYTRERISALEARVSALETENDAQAAELASLRNDLAESRITALPGPFANDAAAASKVLIGGYYFDNSGVTRRRMT
ncbi:cellulase family glycosylhydrolase [Rhodovastum atsumiense]|uniref:Cellulase family glycosylhydrolase n=1 Tax=Rhodovastum atsumiense TaxID=504468 RepID=A0A5M6ITD4_9PROT|nr:cellulase family glycosylhydrolase [Rhodovastum atsumiense]KAA5611574.1 cellulase family glycosylhydrolase [Rhodovastum atsumiense]